MQSIWEVSQVFCVDTQYKHLKRAKHSLHMHKYKNKYRHGKDTFFSFKYCYLLSSYAMLLPLFNLIYYLTIEKAIHAHFHEACPRIALGFKV